MNGTLTLGAALLLGLAASGHCVVMCGGISSALGLATAKNASGRPRPSLLVGYQLGRITSYSLAGLLFAGLLGGLITLLDWKRCAAPCGHSQRSHSCWVLSLRSAAFATRPTGSAAGFGPGSRH